MSDLVQWRPMNTAPKDGTTILVLSADGVGWSLPAAYRRGNWVNAERGIFFPETFARGWLPLSEGTDTVELRPEVARFAALMEVELQKNDHKPGWQRDSLEALFSRLRDENAELALAIASDKPLQIIKEAADVANFALMIADNAARLLKVKP